MLVAWLRAAAFWSAWVAGLQRVRADGADAARDALHPRARGTHAPWRAPLTLTAAALVGAGLALQLWVPAVLPHLQRDAGRIAAGEWWRLGTALLVQDGGLAGGLSNLVGLLAAGTIAERRWGRRRWLAVCGAGALAGEIVALWWQPIGAGNSVANFGLAGGLVASSLRARGAPAAQVPAVAALVAFALLLAARDIHGAAAAGGFVVGLSIADC